MKIVLPIICLLIALLFIPQPNEPIPMRQETVTAAELGIEFPKVERSYTDQWESMGVVKITYYSTDPSENGGWVNEEGNSITATGGEVIPYLTAAIQTGALPYHTIIWVEGLGYRQITDCGVFGGRGHIDLAVTTKEEAAKCGVDYREVWIVGRPLQSNTEGACVSCFAPSRTDRNIRRPTGSRVLEIV